MTATPPNDDERTQAGVQSVENGLALVLVIAHNRRPMKLTALAEQAGVSPAKAHRYLVSFARAGFVAQDPETGLYGLGPVALEFSLSCLATIEPITIATREAQGLCVQTGLTTVVCVWGTFGPTVVRWEQPPLPALVNTGLGTVYPLYRSATGRVFAAFMRPDVIRQHLDSAGRSDQPDAEALRFVEEIRERRMARARGTYYPGISSLAAPVFDESGRLVLCITVFGYKDSFDHEWDGPAANALRDAAARCSKQLGYTGR